MSSNTERPQALKDRHRNSRKKIRRHGTKVSLGLGQPGLGARKVAVIRGLFIELRDSARQDKEINKYRNN